MFICRLKDMPIKPLIIFFTHCRNILNLLKITLFKHVYQGVSPAEVGPCELISVSSI